MVEASRLREELSKAKSNKDRQSAENKVVLPLRKKNSEFNTTTGSLVGSLQKVKVRAVETEKSLKKA